jgi:uncharacterized protein
MPVAVSYPGVYIEEIASGVRTITGVATSIAAFAGSAPKGPTDRAELVLSWSDFDRKFGGLSVGSYLGYAVSHFFANGGQRAYIIRLVAGASSPPAATDPHLGAVTLNNLKIEANSPGDWANDYAIVTAMRPAPDANRFRLKVVNIKQDKKGITAEVFENLSMDSTDARYVVNVLKNESSLITASIVGGSTNPPPAPPTDTSIPSTGAHANEIPSTSYLAGGLAGPLLAPTGSTKSAFETALNAAGTGTGGVYLLDRIDLFNLLCVPGVSDPAVLASLEGFCQARRAFLIADCASDATMTTVGPDGTITGNPATNAAYYFPWVLASDPLQENRPAEFPPCGFVAGIYARTDSTRGVWKAPAGTDASLVGVVGVKTMLTNDENGVLNPKAVNCIRTLPIYGTVLWGARTLQGNDERGSEWKYIPVRRTALFLEESLFRALKWVVFEPNDEPLWAQIRLNVGAFMQGLFRQGAFQGMTPKDAYFVKCDKETTTQNDINLGIVNIVVGFAPLKPAEFVIIKLQQMAGQIQT